LAANAFIGGDYLDDLEALREDVAIQKAIGRKEIPDPTTAGDFCRRFSLGHILQWNRAYQDVYQSVYQRRPEVTAWTLDVDAKVQEVYGEQKEGAATSYNGIFSLQPMYAFVHETDELIQAELRSGNTHPGGKAVAFLRRLKRKVPDRVSQVTLRSDSALYNREVIEFCEKEGWGFSITADQTRRLMEQVEALGDWEYDPKDPDQAYNELGYQPEDWPRPYRYLVRREVKKAKGGQVDLFPRYAYYVVATNRPGERKALLTFHNQKGTSERRIGQFTREFLSHLPLGKFMANWAYLLAAQLGYNLSMWLRDLVMPPSFRKKHVKRIRRCVGLVAAKVTQGGRQIRLKVSVLHRWWKDLVYAWERIPTLAAIPALGG
jgi:Transposase DDE domain group 1